MSVTVKSELKKKMDRGRGDSKSTRIIIVIITPVIRRRLSGTRAITILQSND